MKKSFLLMSFILLVLGGFAQNTKMENLTSQELQYGFIENKGQVYDQNFKSVPNVKYIFNTGAGMSIQLKTNGFSYDTYSTDVVEKKIENNEIEREVTYKFHRVDVELVGANQNPQIIAENPSDKYFNYYNSVTPENGATFVSNYQKVTYKDIYQGIDLEFTSNVSNGKSIEYNFIVNPGADASLIQLKYSGANQTELVANSIVVDVANGSFAEIIPASWIKETNEFVNVEYYKTSENTYSFIVPEYSSEETLIIDPTPNLYFSTYIGGSSEDVTNDVTSSTEGYLYVTGNTSSSDNIATTGAYQTSFSGGIDAYISKFNSEGTLIWSTYFGGSLNDYGQSITCDGLEHIYVAGRTKSTTGIATTGAHQTALKGINDVFIARFEFDGTRTWGTYYGGIDDEDASSIINDASGNIYIGGRSKSLTYISTPGVHQSINGGDWDAFVTKFNSSGVQQWGTYYGGTSEEVGESIAIDASNNIYLGGTTYSTNAMSTSGAHQTAKDGVWDGYLVKFNNNGTRLWATYYGGSQDDYVYSIQTDNLSNIYIGGRTASSNAISTTGAYQEIIAGNYDAFLTKFNSSGVRQWGTYYGGTDIDAINSIDIYSSTSIFIAGITYSTSGIATADAYQISLNGITDGFVSRFNQNGALQWGNYFGGDNFETIYSIESYGAGNIFAVGNTLSTTDVTTPFSNQPTYGGGSSDGFFAKFCIPPANTHSVSGDNNVCIGQITTYTVTPSAYATSYVWDLPMGVIGTSSTNSIEVEITEFAVSGNISVYAQNSCTSAPASYFAITVLGDPGDAGTITGATEVCFDETGVNYTVTAIQNATIYNWTLPTGVTGTSTTSEITVDFSELSQSGNISVYGSNDCGATGASTSIAVTVNQLPADAGTITGETSVCQGETNVTYSVPAISGANSYL
ncbi:MAG: SBBP repeat-containing protein [Bacteroidales bacterium]|nr:SBBP repeat-containing protein [Bacteroidales bacterium]